MSALSIESLYGMLPDPAGMQAKQFDLILQNMKYCLQHGNDTQQDWLKTFIRDTTTNLPQDREESLKDEKIKRFYNERLAVAYLGRAFDNMTGEGAPKTKLTDEQRRRLSFYLTAGLTHDEGFNLQNAQLLKDTYKACTGIKDYLNDTSTHWGQKLLAKLHSEKNHLLTVMKKDPNGALQQMASNFTKLKVMGMNNEANAYYKIMLHNHAMTAVDNVNNVDALWQTGLEAFIQAMESGDRATKVLDTQSLANAREIKRDLDLARQKMGSLESLSTAICRAVGAVSNPNMKIWTKLDNMGKAFTQAEAATAARALGLPIAPGEDMAVSLAKKIGVKAGSGLIKSLRFFAVMGAVAVPCFFIFQLNEQDADYKEKKIKYSLQIVGGLCQAMPKYLIPAAGKMLKVPYTAIRNKFFTPNFEAWTVVDVAGDEVNMVASGVLKTRVQWYEEVFCAARVEWMKDLKATVQMTEAEEQAFTAEIADLDNQLKNDMGIDGFWGRDMNALIDTETGSFTSFAETRWGKIFSTSRMGTFFKGLGSVVALGLAGVSIYDFYEDFNEDKSLKKKILDGISMGTALGFAACAITETLIAAEVVTSEMVAAAVPVIGPVLAIAGLIAAAVGFATADVPKSPIDKFMDETLIPAFGAGGFIKPFDDNTKTWKDGMPVPTVNPYAPKAAAPKPQLAEAMG